MASTALLSGGSNVFEDDDVETCNLLELESSAHNEDMQKRLQNLASRFSDDFEVEGSQMFWDELCRTVSSRGFRVTNTKNSNSFAKSSSDTKDFPAAFKEETGKVHIRATAALLQVSDHRAMQLTMNTFRELETEWSQLQSLLGTRELLLKVMDHYFQQRSARLGTIAECLRLEQSEDSKSDLGFVIEILDSLDTSHKVDGLNRGLFKTFLSIACQPEKLPSREQLQPSIDLRTDNPSTLRDSISEKSSAKSSWSDFVIHCERQIRDQTFKERSDAMEALLVLLYQRIDGGMRRPDTAMAILAFQQAQEFFSNPTEGQRLSQLAGLICAECMSLWKVFESEADSHEWTKQHPLLTNAVTSRGTEVAEVEIEALTSLLLEVVRASRDKPRQLSLTAAAGSSTGQDVMSPESIALLSFGLLLKLSYLALLSSPEGSHGHAFWQTFNETGTKLAQLANNDYDAIGYLFDVIESLASGAKPDKYNDDSTSIEYIRYEWRGTNASTEPLLLEDEKNSNGALILYTSIGREVLAATIAAFKDTILSVDHEAAYENVGVLCGLAAVIYQDSPALCEEFWIEWAMYVASDPPARSPPICCLLDFSHALVVKGLQSTEEPRPVMVRSDFLYYVAPFLQLIASFCHDSDAVENTLPMLPPGLIRATLTNILKSTDKLQVCENVISSISELARKGRTNNCRQMLRDMLEGESTSEINGPQLLSRIISSFESTMVTQHVLSLGAELLIGAPHTWTLLFCRSLTTSKDQRFSFRSLLDVSTSNTPHAIKVLASLVNHLSSLLFSESISTNDTILLLDVATESMLSASAVLASSVSPAQGLFGKVPLTTNAAQLIMKSYSKLLNISRLVSKLHVVSDVRTAASSKMSDLIQNLASSTGLGQAISFYATMPVSLSLSIELQKYLSDSHLVQMLSKDPNSGPKDSDKFGAWYSASSTALTSVSKKDPVANATLLLGKSVDEIDTLEIDFRGILSGRSANNGETKTSMLRTASSAINLLLAWAEIVEDTVSEKSDEKSADPTMRVDLLSLSPQGLLVSMATIPPVLRGSNTLYSAWSSLGCSNFELLLGYLSNENQANGIQSSSLAASILDLLHTCLMHVQCFVVDANVSNVPFFKAISHSDAFYQLLADCVSGAIPVIDKSPATLLDRMKLSNGILGLRIMALCAASSQLTGNALLTKPNAAIISVLTRPILQVVKIFDHANGDWAYLENEQVISNLRFGAGCLEVVSNFWKSSLSTSHYQFEALASFRAAIRKDEPKLFTSLLSVITRHSSLLEVGHTSQLFSEKCVLQSFILGALDLLSTEMQSTNAQRKDLDFEADFTSVLNGDLTPLATKCCYFAHCDSFTMVADSFERCRHLSERSRSCVNLSYPLKILYCFRTTAALNTSNDFLAHVQKYNTTTATLWLDSLQLSSPIDDMVSNLAVSHQLLSNQLQIVSKWRKFVELVPCYAAFVRADSTTENALVEFATSNHTKLIHLVRETLDGLDKNCMALKKSQINIAGSYLQDDMHQMATALSDLVLLLSDLSTTSVTAVSRPEEYLEVLALLSRTSGNLLDILTSSALDVSRIQSFDVAEVCCLLQKPLLTSAVIFAIAAESTMSTQDSRLHSSRVDVYSTLVDMVAKVVKLLENMVGDDVKNLANKGLSRSLYRDCLVICTSLLTMLSRVDIDTIELKEKYFSAVFRIMAEYDIFGSLIHQASAASSIAATKGGTSRVPISTNNRIEPEAEIGLVKSVLLLIGSFADTDDSRLLALIIDSSISRVVTCNPLFAQASSSWTSFDATNTAAPRGYTSTDDQRNKFQDQISGGGAMSYLAGKTDPIHDVWLICLKTMQGLLRASARHPTLQSSRGMKNTIFDMSVHFLVAYRGPLLGCLRECSIPIQGSDLTKLTLNALEEASLILSIVTELCNKGYDDLFIASNQALCEEFVRWSTAVVVSISVFLGASGTARELFLALADHEKAEVAADDSMLTADAQSRNPLLAAGISHAKHEAIRYSHFASVRCAAVTKMDFENTSIVPSKFRSLSEKRPQDSQLERNCRLSVISSFTQQIEHAAAKCVGQAVALIRATHPATRSFVVYTENEALALNAMPLVKPGMIIAIRPMATRGWSSQRSDNTGDIRFGRVLGCDTVNRLWRVQIISKLHSELDARAEVEDVLVQQLAGIEEIGRRKCVLEYSGAPNSVSELDQATREPSVGHLILLLKWCRHAAATASSSDERSMTHRIAEGVCALLGTEVSLHNEIGSPTNMVKSERIRLEMQLNELFAESLSSNDSPSFSQNRLNSSLSSSMSPPSSAKRENLKSLLSPPVWQAIQVQTQLALNRAEKEMQEEIEKVARSSGQFQPQPLSRSLYAQHSDYRI